MGHPGGQLSQRRQFFRLDQLGVGLIKLFLHGDEGAQVLVNAHCGDLGIILVDDGGIQFHRYFPAFGIQDDRVGA